jgi:hypothetical protein
MAIKNNKNIHMNLNHINFYSLIMLFLLSFNGIHAQSIERVLFSSAASANDNFQPIVGAPYGAAINTGTGNLEVSAEYGENNFFSVNVDKSVTIQQSSIKVYPNPTQDKLIVDLSQLQEQNITICITDLQGKLIHNQKALLKTESIDFSKYATGVYLLQLNQPNGLVQSYRIVKQ